MIKERSKRHGNANRNQIYSSDVPALKKLEILEKKEIDRQKKIAMGMIIEPTQQKKRSKIKPEDENMLLSEVKRKAETKPTASEQRSLRKLFRRQEEVKKTASNSPS